MHNIQSLFLVGGKKKPNRVNDLSREPSFQSQLHYDPP